MPPTHFVRVGPVHKLQALVHLLSHPLYPQLLHVNGAGYMLHVIKLDRLQLVGHRQGLKANLGKATKPRLAKGWGGVHPCRVATQHGGTPSPALHLQCMWGLRKMRCGLCSPHKHCYHSFGFAFAFWAMREMVFVFVHALQRCLQHYCMHICLSEPCTNQ